MHISALRIRHFRNFAKAKFIFRKGVNTLIGENGSGKTNALTALRLLLDESMSRNAVYLRESDFCRALGNWHGHWVVIAIDFEELDPSEGCQLVKHAAGHMDGTNTGTYTFLFRPKLDVRRHLHEMTSQGLGDEEFKTYLNTLTTDNYEPVFTGRAQADLLDDDAYRALVGTFEGYNFPDPAESDQALLGVRIQPIHQEITCTFVPALRDVVSDLRGYRSNPLLALLRGTESNINIVDAGRITEAVKNLNQDISSLSEIRGIASGVQTTLHSTVGHAFSPAVGIESALPDSIDKLLQRLTITVGDDPGTAHRGEISELSLGGANLIYLALKLLEYEMKLSGDRVAHFLLIEEPEAHIHTHIQKTLFESHAARKTQVILSTHSTHISSAAKIRSVNVLARKASQAEVYQPAGGLGEPEAMRVERYLDAVRSTLLFAKGVILVEGEAELVMIPAMVKAVFGILPDELGISVISMDAAFFEHVALIFHNDRLRRRCSIVTDLDASLEILPEDPADDDSRLRHYREAERAGEQRRGGLGTFSQDNPWLQAFYATHTFEVDFLASNNAREVSAIADAIYSRNADRARVREALGSEDVVIAGEEVLRLAEKVGKGWFAILLSEVLYADTVIPQYILRAIAYSCCEIVTADAIKRIGLYRLENEQFDQQLRSQFPGLDALKNMTGASFVSLFRETAPDDPLSQLVGFVEEFRGNAEA